MTFVEEIHEICGTELFDLVSISDFKEMNKGNEFFDLVFMSDFKEMNTGS